MFKIRNVSMAGVVAGWMVASAVGAAPTTSAVLDGYKTASGGDVWTNKQTLDSQYDLAAYGMRGTARVRTDLTDGRSAETDRLGPMLNASGFDGTLAWQQDSSGMVTPQESADARLLAVNQAYRNANLWWRADRGGAEIALAQKSENGRSFDVLRITPKGGKAFEAWFSPDRLLVRIVEAQGSQTVVTRFADYIDCEGAKLPKTTEIDSGTGEKYLVRLTLKSAHFTGAQPPEAYAPPKNTVADFEIVSGNRTTVPFRLINNHIYADVLVNGKGPYTFIFDTGGMNLLTGPLAKELGLKIAGALPTTGSGEGVMEGGVTHFDRLQIGNAVLKDQTSYLFPLDTLSKVEGLSEIGMVGFETFRRFVTQIDYGKLTLTLIDPKAFDPKDAGIAIPFTFSGHVPEVKGTFEGIPAVFQIDTGSRSELTVNKPFAERNALRASHKGVDTVDGWGVGGPSTGYATRAREITIGSVKLENVIATLADQEKGAFSGDDYNGNIGGGILKRFVVTFDYGNRIMYLKPLSPAPSDIGTYDRAGMWFNVGADGFDVVAVTMRSPAAAAGIVKGDKIVAVDGTPAKTLLLYEVRRMLRTASAGTIVRFEIEREGLHKTVSVVLRDPF